MAFTALITGGGGQLASDLQNVLGDDAVALSHSELDIDDPQAIERAFAEHAPDVVRSGGLYGFAGNASKGGNFVQRMIARAREQASLKMVADQRLQPTFTEDLAKALVDAVERDATGVLHLTNEGEMSWYDFTVAIMENAAIDVPIEPGTTTVAPGGVDRPL